MRYLYINTVKKYTSDSLITYYFILLKNLLQKFINGFLIKKTYLSFFSKKKDIFLITYFLKNNSFIKMHSLADIVVVDNLGKSKYRFSVIYFFMSPRSNLRISVRLALNLYDNLISISSIFAGANWLEREVWDMFGIHFIVHPNKRRILTDYGFKGFPLRKDFPLVGYLELRYDDTRQSIASEPVSNMQSYRMYSFNLSWVK